MQAGRGCRVGDTRVGWAVIASGGSYLERKALKGAGLFNVLESCADRKCEPELMDDPALDAERHHEALRGLASLNSLSASARLIWKPIVRLVREQQTSQLRVLDIATGGGDIPIALWRRANRAGIQLDILGVDISARGLEHAGRRAEVAGASVRFEVFDAVNDEFLEGYDVVMCSTFLHHLSEEYAMAQLSKMRKAAGRMVLVNDLARSTGNLFLTHLGAKLFTRSDVVRVDGPRSIKAAFTIPEMRDMAERAGLNGARIAGHWPCRFLLEWQKQ